MTCIGFFSEMHLHDDNGSVKDHIVDKVDYDKDRVISYLNSQKLVAGCPRAGIDCVTGGPISMSFLVYTDGEYEWCDFLPYHIEKYNIKLPKELIEKINAFIETEKNTMEEKKIRPQDKWDAKAGLISKSYKVNAKVAEAYKEACKTAGVSMGIQLTKMMEEFIEEVNSKS